MFRGKVVASVHEGDDFVRFRIMNDQELVQPKSMKFLVLLLL